MEMKMNCFWSIVAILITFYLSFTIENLGDYKHAVFKAMFVRMSPILST